MTRLLLVGAGGFVGAILRYAAGGWALRLSPTAVFPYGTLLVNAVGCLAIGLLAGYAELRDGLSPEARALLLVGLLGGFTTFSAFGYETFQFLRDGYTGVAMLNVVAQLLLGLGGVWVGYSLAKLL